MSKKIVYRASGRVLGNYWGGGQGAYTAKTLSSDNIDTLRSDIENGIKTGSLDAGMGYEKVTGAYMQIETITDLLIDGKVFSNVSSHWEFFGDFTKSQKVFLEECGL